MDEQFSKGFTSGMLFGIGVLVILSVLIVLIINLGQPSLPPSEVSVGSESRSTSSGAPGSHQMASTPPTAARPGPPPPPGSGSNAEEPPPRSNLEIVRLTTELVQSRQGKQTHQWKLVLKNNRDYGTRFRAIVKWRNVEGDVVYSNPPELVVMDPRQTIELSGNVDIPVERASDIASVSLDILRD